MPTYVLEGGSEITLPARPVSVRLQAGRGGARPDSVRLVVQGEHGPVRAITPTPGMLVVPQVPGPVTVRAVPAGGDRFGPGSVLSLVIGYESRTDLDPDRGVLDGLDVSGLRGRDVFTLVPEGDRIRVSVLGPAAADAPLSPVAAAARDAAREVLGTDQLGPRLATDALIVIDTSASMLPLISDGTVGRVVDVLAGVHRVIGRPATGSLTVTLAAQSVRRLGPTSPERVGDLVAPALRDLPLVVGFRLDAALAPPGVAPVSGAPAPVGQVWVITDGTPAEAARFAGRDDLHLVLPLPRSAADAAVGTALPTTVVPLSETPGPVDLGAAGGLVAEIVASLLTPRWTDRVAHDGTGAAL